MDWTEPDEVVLFRVLSYSCPSHSGSTQISPLSNVYHVLHKMFLIKTAIHVYKTLNISPTNVAICAEYEVQSKEFFKVVLDNRCCYILY